ncbi:uncharacterized protein LOC110096034 isoform X2 [Dendrobium catenatum]|uniref:E3 ubiquitin-protein ligase SDIR1 n=2 Tax=Dendrobium catenatum TaxID=906689 RepID=A0A2I0VSD8_9ASPA|nr:uncharacterized protein LOC110096034 isoform X2 [Dendrobium catenatum]XP_020677451.1 uncharacterized protein LOC110096034 isoform X2 [Dendrobium catenatum]PKU66324.1 E3 ubiquitin-protein ligase SDIR1 [Dendrobium catenatum]
MKIGVGFDALNSSNKRVKRSSTGKDSVESSAREDDLVEAIDASVSDMGMLPWKPMNGLRCKIGRAAKGNRNSIVAQKRAGNESGRREVIISPDVGSSLPFQRRYVKKKGKVNLEDHTLKDVQHGEPTNLSSRAALFGKEVVTVADEQGSFESYQNLGLQKAQDFKINMKQLSHTNSRNNKAKLSSSYLPEGMHDTDIEDKGNANVIGKCPQITTQGHISYPHHGQAFPDPVVSKRNRSCKKTAKGKRKCNSLSSNFGETSVSASHAGISNLNQEMSNENGFYGTAVIEIDELYPEAKYCVFYGQSEVFDISSAIADQIESDEIFSRELQEEFDHETTRVIRLDMVNATIAWPLQQDEDEYAATLSENDRSKSEDATVAWSLQQDEDEDEDEDAATLPQNDRSKSERIDEIRGKLQFEADLDKRFELYEEWEDLLENRDERENDDPASNHSINNTENAMQFDSDDSDDSDDQHVYSSVINNLPLILIQNNNVKEACAVCLEIPAVGETMRYLPCLHKFHKMCIDTWLKIKPACPVCKFKLTLS